MMLVAKHRERKPTTCCVKNIRFIRIMSRCLKPVARRIGVALTQSWGGGEAVGNGRPACLLPRQSLWLRPIHFPDEPNIIGGDENRTDRANFALTI